MREGYNRDFQTMGTHAYLKIHYYKVITSYFLNFHYISFPLFSIKFQLKYFILISKVCVLDVFYCYAKIPWKREVIKGSA